MAATEEKSMNTETNEDEDPMSITRSRIGGILLIFNFKEDINGFEGIVHIVISGDDNEDIYLSKAEISEAYQKKHLCKIMVTYCLKRAYQIVKQEKPEGQLTGDVIVSTKPEYFEAAKYCYIISFANIGFQLTSEFREEYYPEGAKEDAQIISQILQFTEEEKTKEQTALFLAKMQESLLVPHLGDQYWKQGGFFFNKKNKRKKTRKKRKKKKKKTRKKKDRKWTDTSYPYRDISAKEAIEEFQKLKKLVKGDINPRSIVGNKTVDWGTEKARRKTKYRNKSFIEMWKNKTRRKKMMQFAKRLHKAYRGPDGKKKGNKTILSSTRSAIDLQWGSVNTMRAAAAAQMYKKYKATRVLDFTAGWGARMIAAMALNIDYIGIDSNKALKPGYDKLIKLLKPYTKSNIKMIYKEAEKVKFSKLGKYDYVFTSPPYEYLEAYENMTNYEKKGSKIVQPSSSKNIKMDHSTKFYDEFLIPTLKKAYKYLPRNKYICLNMPDMMYDKIKKRWKKVTRKETYQIIKRTGGPIGKDRRGKECIFCWKKS